MPCILKQKTKDSPGIVTFTHNEVLYGIINKSSKVKKFLNDQSEKKNWIFGVHIQGWCSNLEKWPLESWQSFILWPDLKTPYLANVPKKMLPGINCINLLPKITINKDINKKWDLCVVSRPSTIKRIKETMDIIRSLMNKKPNLKVIFIVPDPRDIKKGEHTYELDDIDRYFFESPKKNFSAEELKNLYFICSPSNDFGHYPIACDLVADLIQKSKFLLLTSHKEGMARVLGDALQVGTPCIVPKSLESGIRYLLTSENTLFIDDDISVATNQILKALNTYSCYYVNIKEMEKFFGYRDNIKILKKYLLGIIKSSDCEVKGEWYLMDLYLRLAGHGQKYYFQFMDDEKVFFSWFDKIIYTDPYDEDKLWEKEITSTDQGILIQIIKKRVGNIHTKLLINLIQTKKIMLKSMTNVLSKTKI